MTLFDPDGETAARNEAMQRALDHADPEWKRRAAWAVYNLARTSHYFTTDDVWTTGLAKPREARALGPIIKRAEKKGIVRSTGEFRLSNQTGCHRMPKRVWESLIYRASEDEDAEACGPQHE